jgi:hypothetical protein
MSHQKLEDFFESPSGKELREIMELDVLTKGDVWRANQTIKTHDDPFGRRQYLRAVTAHAEALTSMLKFLALSGRNSFTDAERALLTERTHFLNADGEVQESALFLSLDRNIRFAFRAYAGTGGVEFRLDVKTSGWRDFKTTLRVRNRLMHPRRLTDLAVSDRELDAARCAHGWMKSQHYRMTEVMLEKILYDKGFTAEDFAAFKEQRAQQNKEWIATGLIVESSD